MDQPLVSIVVPCYNGETHLMECMQSLLAQTYENCEIIVIDDGSSDGSVEILKSLGDCIRFETGPNQGACAARNRGLELASGKYVKFFDADDVMLPHAIASQVKAAEKLAKNEFLYGNLVDLDSQEIVFNEIQTTSGTSRDEMVYACFCKDIITGCPLHQRQFLIDHNLRFDTRLLDGQEWDFHLAIALAGGVFVFEPEIIYQYRSHDDPDRISQVLTDPVIKINERWLKLSGACQKIIDAYDGGMMYPPIKVKMRRRLCKTEAQYISLNLEEKAASARRIRRQLDSPIHMFFTDIRYIHRRYFSKKR